MDGDNQGPGNCQEAGSGSNVWNLMGLQARVNVWMYTPSRQDEAQPQVCACDKHAWPGDLGSV